jgi:TRAP-type C4-dicarboxylate transport system substrate-binding protein
MRKAAHEAGEEINQLTRIENDEAIEAMKKRGLTVHTPTPEVEAAWVKLAERTYPHIRGRIVPAATYDEVQRLLAEFRQRQTSAKP